MILNVQPLLSNLSNTSKLTGPLSTLMKVVLNPMNTDLSDVFYHWTQTLLLSQLPANSVIVMDNATFHKRQDIQDFIENAGHAILWLPSYGPDFNPIENTWAWVKQKRRDWRLGCVDSLFFYFMWICTIF